MQFLLLPIVALVALLLMLALPILLPLLSFLADRDHKRLCAAAEATPCALCGHLLGPAAVEAADTASAATFTKMLQLNLRPRVVRRLFARCTSCGADHGWNEDCRKFYLLDAPDLFE